MLPTLATKTVTILRPDLIEDHGTQIADWSSPTLTSVPGCDVQPLGTGGRESDEQLANRDAVVAQLRAWLPPGTDVRATDRVRYGGTDYEIHGEPQEWTSSSGILDHVEVLLRHVEG